MSELIYLYLKTHNKTGLKYLGTTRKNPYVYQGSGVYWKNHIKTHGYDVTTTVLFESTSEDEIKIKGLEYSELMHVVESDEYANLIPEQGEGGSYWKGKTRSPATIKKMRDKLIGRNMNSETKQKISESHKGKKNSKEHNENIRKANLGKTLDSATRQKISDAHMGKSVSNETRARISEANKGNPKPKIQCPHCKKIGGVPQMKQWHFDNCKNKT